ncbi:MAG TPA: carboxypeptidase M32 [Verrucomicrobiae bacterium]|nr:carboxypeptidase M32 [Verrucomicrobiae bacterium]
METKFAPYRNLLKRSRQIAWVSSAAEALAWDIETYMPPKALDFRAEQMGHLSGHTHRLFTARKTGDWIAACEQNGFVADSPEAANVREWRRRYDRAAKLPARLVERFQKTCAHAREAWKKARQESNFKIFKPHLKKVLELSRQRADYWGFPESPYDALLDEFEPGMRAGQARALFAQLRPAITSVLGAALKRSASVPEDLLKGNYPTTAQQALNRRAAEAIGFDFSAGRIDTTTHPFCTTLGPGDCRLTTRYNEQNFTQSFYGVLHEAGHGLYEQGLPTEHFGTPLGSAASLGIHESQSRLWENHIGRHPDFWKHWHPIACEHFPELKRIPPEQLAAAVNRVAPSFIRVEADQVTYDLHIILRFEIEVKMIEGQLPVADVPAYWNEEFQKMLGLKITRDSDGCLQDIHWSMGSIGYFPTYTLGNLNAAQLMRRAMADNPNLESALAQGQYQTLLAWLRQKVHRHGLRYLPQELMQQATGETTQTAHHLEYLRAKFL